MSWGGKRTGSGRPKGQGKDGEGTKVIRIPVSLEESVRGLIDQKGYELPLYSTSVQAGFPSPADDHVDQKLNLHHYLVQNTAATFFVRVSGDSMIEANIAEGDILVVDRSLNAKPLDIVVAALNGELTVKRLIKKGDECWLKPENPLYPLIPLQDTESTVIWGVVTSVVRKII